MQQQQQQQQQQESIRHDIVLDQVPVIHGPQDGLWVRCACQSGVSSETAHVVRLRTHGIVWLASNQAGISERMISLFCKAREK
jgi:hypothetical protein